MSPPAPLPSSHLLLPTLVLVTATTSVVSSLGAPLVPEIALRNGVSLGTAQWTLTVTLLVGAVATPVLGRLGGNRLRRPAILVGLSLVTLGTALAALDWAFGALLVGRALQGIGLGLTPLALAVAREFVPAERLPGAISLLSVATVAGAGLGYPVTAYVADAAGLAAAYGLGFAVCLTAFVLAWVAVPASRSVAVEPVDWWGAGLLSTGTAALLLAVSQGDPWGWISLRVWGLGLGSAAALALWVRRSLRVQHPLVDLRLAARKTTLPANLVTVLAGVAVYMLLSLAILQVQAPVTTGFGLGLPVTTAGLLLVPYSIASVLGSRVALRLTHWVRPAMVLRAGCLVYLGATLALARWHGEVWQLMVVMAVSGVGSGATFATVPGIVVRAVPATETGSATSFNHLLRVLGFSAGSALALALLEAFSAGGALDDAAYTRTIGVAAALWAVAAVVSGPALGRWGVRRAGRGR